MFKTKVPRKSNIAGPFNRVTKERKRLLHCPTVPYNMNIL